LGNVTELISAGNYAAALTEAQRYEAAIKVEFGTNHANYAAALHNLAIVYWSQGKYVEAAGLYQRTLAIQEKALGASFHLEEMAYRDLFVRREWPPDGQTSAAVWLRFKHPGARCKSRRAHQCRPPHARDVAMNGNA
jgi:tetratricopeptide (TPR) repeat protein